MKRKSDRPQQNGEETLTELEDYAWLTGGEANRWLEELANRDDPVLRQIERLRKVLGAERSRLVVEQAALRRRAVAKFGTLASRMFFTDIGLQQATDRWIARYKATRLSRTGRVVDYCCGIGGDLLALAERGAVVGWDCSPEIVRLAAANLREVRCVGSAEVRLGHAEDQSPAIGDLWHIDPDRRVDGQRSTQVHWHSPGPEIVDRWLAINPHGMLKLAPAAKVPESWQCQAELEWISRDRECRQLVVWFGELGQARGQRRATCLEKCRDADEPVKANSFCGDPRHVAPIAKGVEQFVYDVDPAVRASGLTGALAIDQDLSALAAGAAYLTSARHAQHPLLTCFQVIDTLPMRVGRLSKYLRSQGIGQLEIKKRGVDIAPEPLRRQLKLRGSDSATLLLGRLGVREIAILARRFDTNAAAAG